MSLLCIKLVGPLAQIAQTGIAVSEANQAALVLAVRVAAPEAAQVVALTAVVMARIAVQAPLVPVLRDLVQGRAWSKPVPARLAQDHLAAAVLVVEVEVAPDLTRDLAEMPLKPKSTK